MKKTITTTTTKEYKDGELISEVTEVIEEEDDNPTYPQYLTIPTFPRNVEIKAEAISTT